MSNFFIEDIRHTEKLYSISYFFLREVDCGSIGGVEEQAELEGISLVFQIHFASCFLISDSFCLRALLLSNFQCG